ncbi:MAG: hypothetical protein LIO74_05140 [Ruminococcus sp.]|nr:hypothetical protein [Ruminococcus sp.]
MYFNTAIKDDTRISELLQFFRNSVSDSVSFGRLSDRVKFYKETEEGVNHMCDAVRVYGDKREEAGMEAGRRQDEAIKLKQVIAALMQNTKCTLDEALHMTGYTMKDYQESLAVLSDSANS